LALPTATGTSNRGVFGQDTPEKHDVLAGAVIWQRWQMRRREVCRKSATLRFWSSGVRCREAIHTEPCPGDYKGTGEDPHHAQESMLNGVGCSRVHV